MTVQPGVQPPPHRYFHSACYVPSKRAMYIYGGLSDTSYLSDLWSFSIDTEGWTLLNRPVTRGSGDHYSDTSNSKDTNVNTRIFNGGGPENYQGDMEFLLPPPVAGHTISYCKYGEKEVLLLIGGVSDDAGFLEVVWQYDVYTGVWSTLNTTGTVPLGLFGHSTVYHSSDRVFYVYGGYSYQVDKVGLFGHLYAFHYPTRVWSLLPTDNEININSVSRPAPRAFHTAVTTNDYMLVIGGYIEEQRDLKQTLIAYSYKCNMWVPLNGNFLSLAGPELSSSLGLSSAIVNSIVYVFGGFSGVTSGQMMSIDMSDDLCVLNANKSQCRDIIGCANCVVYRKSHTNSSYCYSNSREGSKLSACLKAKKRGDHPGKVCDATILQQDCYQYTTCAACLASYPAVSGSKQKCKWCNNCLKGKCIPKENNCSSDALCERNRNKTGSNNETAILDANHCLEKSCAASDCFKCEKLKQCIWTRQVLRSPDYIFNLSLTPTYNWNCVGIQILNHSSHLVESSPPQTCPLKCQYHKTCRQCLDSDGGEGGWQGCYWSPSLETCMAPSYVPLRCMGGRCGILLQEPPCPILCSQHTNCSACLQQPQCGWCGIVTAVGGLGICAGGDMTGPNSMTCNDFNYDHLLSNHSVVSLHELRVVGEYDISWNYLKCPPENECRSGHHSCHPITEVCVDEDQGYKCVCTDGYNSSRDGECIPLCSQGCVYGACVQPDRCSCNFGYVGSNCSIKCQCNGHADCAGPDKLSECIKCHNNTRGSQCDRCERFFVGNPVNNGSCVSCYNYCHTHSSECYPRHTDGKLASMARFHHDFSYDTLEIFTEAKCYDCVNNTSGYECDSCLPGYFRGSTELRKPCKHCECNGHSDTCDQVWGDNCKCSNNTISPCTANLKTNKVLADKDEDKDCQKMQCTKCKDSYLGNPSKGHQCYYQMTVEKEYCLDPDSQNRCEDTPRALQLGHTVYFGVQPKFMNVNIRLVLDITKGSVKVYFSSEEDAFLVNVDKNTWRHSVKIDSKYPLKQEHSFFGNRAVTREYIGNGLGMHDIINVATSLSKEIPSSSITRRINDSDYSTSKFRLIEREAHGLKTFITVHDPNDILIVYNVTNRLVLTLPQNGHDLRSARFYLIIEGKSDDIEASVGSVFFRQDQPRIDLFVFFSVFFSCFFLFLAVCVVVWKIKQCVDIRRARLRHVVEMLHMAKRPFAVMTLVMQVSCAESCYWLVVLSRATGQSY